MEYVTLATLIHHILGFCLTLWSLRFSTIVLFHKRLFKDTSKFSPMIIVYFIFLFLYDISSIVNFSYLISFWRPNDNIYDPVWLYWLGLCPYFHGYLSIVIEIFLCIDRSLSILFPITYTFKYHIYCSILTVLAIIAAILHLLIFCNLRLVLTALVPGKCTIFGCLLPGIGANLSTTRLVLAGLNVTGGIILFILTRIYLKHSNNVNKRIIKTIGIIIICTTIFEIVPTYFSVLLKEITGRNLIDFIGPFSITATSINIAISSTVYSKACLKSFMPSNLAKVGVPPAIDH